MPRVFHSEQMNCHASPQPPRHPKTHTHTHILKQNAWNSATLRNSAFCPHSMFMDFIRQNKQLAFPQNSINQMVIVMAVHCALCGNMIFKRLHDFRSTNSHFAFAAPRTDKFKHFRMFGVCLFVRLGK